MKKEALKKIAIICSLCVASLAFVATSPPPLLSVEKSSDPYVISLSPQRPMRQFRVVVRHDEQDQIPYLTMHFELHFKFMGNLPTSETIQLQYARELAGSTKNCFAQNSGCDWQKGPLASQDTPGSGAPGNPIPGGLLQFRTDRVIETTSSTSAIQGGVIFLRFALQKDVDAQIEWSFKMRTEYDFTNDEELRLEPSDYNMLIQEVPATP